MGHICGACILLEQHIAGRRRLGLAAFLLWLVALGLVLGGPASVAADSKTDSWLYDAYISRIERDTTDVDAFLGLAQLFIKYDYLDNAALACLYARAFRPDDVALHVRTYLILGRGHGERSFLREANQFYMAAIELCPNDPELYAEHGQFADTLEAYEAAAGLKPDVRYHTGMGRVYAAQGQYFEAVGEFRYALVLDSTNAETYHGLGVAFYERDFVDQAIRVFEKAVSIKPGLVKAHHALGIAWEGPRVRRQGHRRAEARPAESGQVAGGAQRSGERLSA